MSGAGHNWLAAVAADVRSLHAGIRRNAEQLATDAIEAGKLLIEAKAALPHGEWETWLRDHAAISPRTARLYMQLVRSGVKSATVAELGLNAAARMIAPREDREKQPPEIPTWPELPLCLSSPPQPGEAFHIVIDRPHRWVVIGESSQYPDFYDVFVICAEEGIGETLRRPVAWVGIGSLLRHLHIHVDDRTEVERSPFHAQASWETLRRFITRQDEPLVVDEGDAP